MNLKSYFFSSTSKDSGILLSGSILSTFLGLITVFLLTKNLSLYEFGLFISALTFVQLFTDFFELGINQATINFLSGKDISHQKNFIFNLFVLKVTSALFIGVFIYFESRFLSELIFVNRNMAPYISFAAFGIVLNIIFNWIQSFLVSQKRFISSSILSLSINLLRVLTLALIFNQFVIEAKEIFLIIQLLISLPIIFIIFKFRSIYKEYLTFANNINNSEILKIVRFGLPLGIAFAISAVYTRLDQIMILKLTNPNEAAIYGLAARITLPLLLVISSFSTAIIPRYVSINDQDFKNYFQKSLVVVGLMSGVVLIGISILPILLPLIFGNSYIPSVIPAQILLIGMIFFILSSPFYNLIIYRFKDTYYSLFLASGSLILVYILLSSLIPISKSMGAAWSIGLVYFSQFIFSMLYTIFKIKKYGFKLLSPSS